MKRIIDITHKFYRWVSWTPLPLSDLEHIAWIELMRNDSITEYIVAEDGMCIPLAQIQAKALAELSVNVDAFVQSLEAIGRAAQAAAEAVAQSLPRGLAQG
jgi:hypothetical protein